MEITITHNNTNSSSFLELILQCAGWLCPSSPSQCCETEQQTSLLHLGLFTFDTRPALVIPLPPLHSFLSHRLIALGFLTHFQINYSQVTCMLLNCVGYSLVVDEKMELNKKACLLEKKHNATTH